MKTDTLSPPSENKKPQRKRLKPICLFTTSLLFKINQCQVVKLMKEPITGFDSELFYM